MGRFTSLVAMLSTCYIVIIVLNNQMVMETWIFQIKFSRLVL